MNKQIGGPCRTRSPGEIKACLGLPKDFRKAPYKVMGMPDEEDEEYPYQDPKAVE